MPTNQLQDAYGVANCAILFITQQTPSRSDTRPEGSKNPRTGLGLDLDPRHRPEAGARGARAPEARAPEARAPEARAPGVGLGLVQKSSKHSANCHTNSKWLWIKPGC